MQVNQAAALMERYQQGGIDRNELVRQLELAMQAHVPKCLRPLCGAKTRAGGTCRAKAVSGKKRCRLHGGLSTGPKTGEGRAKIATSNLRRAQQRQREKRNQDFIASIRAMMSGDNLPSEEAGK